MNPPPERLTWRTSSYSATSGECVEIATTPDGSRWLRDSKHPTSPAHFFTAGKWSAFIAGVKDNEFD